ncbi:ubiquitin carboxyl-terminal hydrolase CYLD-like, partial [Sitodiplosis mosellana]|uniref:ubiquitin carboxyl-terminal hydrolase CYLD-like n=1 Tax=Sitodiplosis mosellana TaxID=263140 RepID=UPI002444D125
FDQFGKIHSPIIKGLVSPMALNELQLENLSGQFKGIQGHSNSCYLDVVLFAMFAFTHMFDALLNRQAESEDIPDYDEIQNVLREDIVNPLRVNLFVRADRVMKLRRLLQRSSSVKGLMSHEKDPEEFVNLLAQIMRIEPFLKFCSGENAVFHQIFVKKNKDLKFPTVQHLLEESFKESNPKLADVPSCLLIQLPRSGQKFKLYQRVLPSHTLDLTNLMGDVPKMSQHKDDVPKMHLFALVCFDTARKHFVAFVKSGVFDAPWCYYDSMADMTDNYNIPEIVSVPNFIGFLSEKGSKLTPDMTKRILCESYICLYQSEGR